MNLIQLLKFKIWEMRLFKMPHLGTPRFQTRHLVTVASGPRQVQTVILTVTSKSLFWQSCLFVHLSVRMFVHHKKLTLPNQQRLLIDIVAYVCFNDEKDHLGITLKSRGALQWGQTKSWSNKN